LCDWRSSSAATAAAASLCCSSVQMIELPFWGGGGEATEAANTFCFQHIHSKRERVPPTPLPKHKRP